jgi:hypothetical protein
VVGRFIVVVALTLAPSGCEGAACRGLAGTIYRTVDKVPTRGCEDVHECGHHLRLEFKRDGTYYLDHDDTDAGGTYTCKDGRIDLGDEVFSAELSESGERLTLRGPGGSTEYERSAY